MTTLVPIPNLRLNNGVEMPALGFGTFAKEGVSGKAHDAVLAALNTGYRHLDCAWYYLNEDEVGSALKQWLTENPTFKREDIFITTKPFACEKTSNNEVKLVDEKYVLKKELTENLEPAWRTMEKLHRDGKTRSIGVSNWTIPKLDTLLAYRSIKPVVNQIEIHPFLDNTSLINYCFSKDIHPVAYSPLGSQNQVPATGERVTTDPELGAIASKLGVSLAQVLIAWGVKRGYAVLPKSSDPARIKSNFQLISLSDDDFAAVNKVAADRHVRFVNLKDTFGLDLWPEEANL